MYRQSDPASGVELVVTSASDLSVASLCEYGFARRIDVMLGRAEKLDEEPDEMLVRASELGDAHEERVLQRYRDAHPGGVVEIDRPAHGDAVAMAEALRRTRQAFADGVPVVFQAAFFVADPDDTFVGYADFIVRRPDGRYRVQDTKLARHAKVTALLQLAAYVDRLEALGVPVDDTVELLLGDGTVSTHRVDDIRPVYRKRWARLRALVDAGRARTTPVVWGDADLFACGQCEACTAAIVEHRDVLQVAGLRITQRDRLAAAGITTIDELAASDGPVPGVGTDALGRLRVQARLQLRATDDGPPPVELIDVDALAHLPAPDNGDLFFDFEGDPLYNEGDDRWGLDYLFGLVGIDERFTAWWAHDFAEERRALRGFLDFVAERRSRHPRMRIYHYASYERTHLSSIAARHGEGEDEVDRLLREHVLVDLYPLVRKVMRVGSPSYSIKKLEPLYMGEELRTADVTTAAASITEYAAARDLIATGQVDEGEAKLQEIADYNRYDCVSTRRLRDWLVTHAERAGVPLGVPATTDTPEPDEPSPLLDDLLALAGQDAVPVDGGSPPPGAQSHAERTDDETAAALASAALDYHRREHKTFWWGHFARLAQPIDEWADTRDVLVVDRERSRVERAWYREGRQRKDRREVRLRGTLAPGSRIAPGTKPYALYDPPVPFPDDKIDPGSRVACPVTVRECADDGSLLIEELMPNAATDPYGALPVALTPGPPPGAGSQPGAIAEWAQAIVDAQPGWPGDAVTDILRRRPPRTRSGALAAVIDDDHVG
ncbi:MAG: TM0106 family RecB-like putative nuclease, partial [Solirubrobacteraceae bacterium]